MAHLLSDGFGGEESQPRPQPVSLSESAKRALTEWNEHIQRPDVVSVSVGPDGSVYLKRGDSIIKTKQSIELGVWYEMKLTAHDVQFTPAPVALGCAGEAVSASRRAATLICRAEDSHALRPRLQPREPRPLRHRGT